MAPQRGPLTFGQLPLVLRGTRGGTAVSTIAHDLGVDGSSVTAVLDRHPRLERMHTRVARRRHLRLGEKLLLLHYVDQNKPRGELCTFFGIHSRKFYRVLQDKDRSRALDTNRVPVTVQRKLFATSPGWKQW